MDFPDLARLLNLEFQVAGRWVDVTDDLTSALPIQYGRANETSTVTPSELSFELDNLTGVYTPDHPASPHWPYIRLGLPVRVSIDTDPLTAPGYAEDFETGLGGWTAPVGTAAVSTIHAHTGTQSLMVSGGSDGQAAQSPNLPAEAGAWQYIGALLYREAVTGAPGVVLAAGFLDADGALLLATDALSVAVPAEEWTRVSVGGLVPPGTATMFCQIISYSPALWVDTAHTRYGAASHRATRFLGEVASVEPSWPSGDTSAPGRDSESTVAITASGITRRLGQGAPALRSAIARDIPGRSSEQVAYWPLEDGPAADRAASALPGGVPMTVTAGKAVDFGSLDIAPGSASVPNFRQASGTLTGTLDSRRFPARLWMVAALVYVEGTETWPAIEVNVNGSKFDTWRIAVGSRVTVTGVEDDATTTVLNHPTVISDTGPHWLGIGFHEVTATSTDVSLILDGQFIATGTATGQVAGRPVRVKIRPRTSGGAATVAHLEFSAEISAGSDDPERVAGFTGETAGRRMERLCKEEAIPFGFIGERDDTALVGPQTPATLLDLLTDAAGADGGILAEALHRPGLVYRTRASLYNQPPAIMLDAASAAGGDIINPFRPALDDQGVRNDITASRTEGGSYRATAETGPRSVLPAPDGIGRYDAQVSVNVASDAQLPGIAGWRLRLGTGEGMRYPVVSPALDTNPALIGSWLGLRLGDRVDVVNLPSQHPAGAVSLLVQGYAETLTPSSWKAQANATPGAPWTVATRTPADWEPLAADRYDTAGAELDATATTSATTLSVRTTAGPRWITTAAMSSHFPFDATVGGEVVRVAGITGTGTVQSFTVTRAANGVNRSHPAGAVIALARPAFRAL